MEEIPSDRGLALLHLRKVFTEFARSQLSSIEYEQKMYKMIPLFTAICKMYEAKDLTSGFKEILQFSSHLTKMFVQEIRRRASNQSTETAAVIVVDYLDPSGLEQFGTSGQDQGKGWLLLKALHYLALARVTEIIEVMSLAVLPSTLAKCLYLFFDLPPLDPEHSDGTTVGDQGLSVGTESRREEWTACQRRIILQETFVDLLTTLCSYPVASEELARKDDLALLFSAVTSWCPPHNAYWRKATSEVLMALSSRAMTLPVLNYLHAKGCIAVFFANLNQAAEGDISPQEKVDMIVCLFCLLKDSASLSPLLMEDMKSINGYDILTDFIISNESNTSVGTEDAIRNLLLMFTSAALAGHEELKPVRQTAMYQLPAFFVPEPQGTGSSVRNIEAFALLQNVFLRSQKNETCCTVLDVISNIFSADMANYFIVERQCPLGQFLEVVHLKSSQVQSKLFELLEFVVFHLNVVPCRELIAASVLLKTQSHTECGEQCLQSLFRILSYNPVFKDVYRDVGILEVLTQLLYTAAKTLEKNEELPHSLKNLLPSIMDMLTVLLKNNSSNAGIFRECEGTKSVIYLVNVNEYRLHALHILQQLFLLPGGDDELSLILTVLHSCPPTELVLKCQVLKSLLFVLRESHRVRLAFRKVGGFLSVVSTLVALEGALTNPPVKDWENNSPAEVLDLLRVAFKVLTLAMRFEPANARFFANEVRFECVSELLRLLGCFSRDTVLKAEDEADSEEFSTFYKTYSKDLCEMFSQSESFTDYQEYPDSASFYICCVVRCLYDMTVDNFEKPMLSQCKLQDVGQQNLSTYNRNSMGFQCDKNLSNLLAQNGEALIVHPGAVLGLFRLLPSIVHTDCKKKLSLQVFVAEILKSLVRSERNQQVMCDSGLPTLMFKIAGNILLSETHPLLPNFYYIIERLSAQAMKPRELRRFLRLDMPLCCRNLDDDSEKLPGEGGPLPLSRVKTLVSMMTPRDFRLAGVCMTPPFVEFDMSIEGFGCLYLPSMAPQGISTGLASGLSPSSLSTDVQVIGGIGTGERVFPPLTGITFLCWLYVEHFSDPQQDSHPIRLLTVIRSSTTQAGKAGQEESNHLGCLTIQVSPLDRALLIDTHESDTPGADLDRDYGPNDSFLRIPLPELSQEQQWNFLAIVFNRALLKNSTVSIYVNGIHQVTEKLHYVVQNPGGGATTLTSASSVSAIIGTPPGPFRKQSRLCWRLGSTYFIEEAWPQSSLRAAFRLGPHYSGSFQCPVSMWGEKYSVMVPEERVTFGLQAGSVTQMTLAKLRKVYSKTDSKAIAKQLGISTHENVTPIRIIHNSAGHLQGPARCLGGVVVGYLGMRTFCPKPVARLLESVGGVSALLGLVAMSSSTEELYATVKALLCAIRSNRAIANEMIRARGYQTLAILLEEKHNFVNTHILHLVFSLAGTLDSSRETTVIPHVQAFEDLLCDLEIWRKTQPDFHRLLYEHFYELITESGDQRQKNLSIVRSIGLISRLIYVLHTDSKILHIAKDVIFNLIGAILQPPPDNLSLLRFGQYLASTLSTSETEKCLPPTILEISSVIFTSGSTESEVESPLRRVFIRSRCLSLLVNVLDHSNENANFQLSEQIIRILGFDWLMEFLSCSAHDTTVLLALRILTHVLCHSTLLQKFREGSSSGGWLIGSESVVQNRAGTLLGFSVSAHGGSVGSACDVNPEICHAPGFCTLQYLLANHAHLPEIYLILLSWLVGKPAKHLPPKPVFNLDTVWALILDSPPSHSLAEAVSKVELQTEVLPVLLSLCRRCLNTNTTDSWAYDYPSTLLQFMTFLYHNCAPFTSYCTSDEFLVSFVAVLFPEPEDNESAVAPPSGSSEGGSVFQFPGETSDVTVINASRRQVTDFLRNILVDSFPVTPASKGDSVVDTILEFICDQNGPDGAQLITTILQSSMEHVLASDALLFGNASSLPLTLSQGSNYNTLAANVFYFASRLVDSVWNGTYIGNPLDVFDSLVKLISQAKRKSGGLPLDSLLRSLNRITLFLLSRPAVAAEGQVSILDCLHKVTGNRSLLFGPANLDTEFVVCLAHLLFHLTQTEPKPDKLTREEDERSKELKQLVANAARRAWEELYMNKKQTLEEELKVSFVPELSAARSIGTEAASRIWKAYLDVELKGQTRDVTQIHAQLQSKIQKVAGGLTRLASMRAKTVRQSQGAKSLPVSQQTLNLWMTVHISLIKELVRLQCLQYQQWHEHVQRYCLAEWRIVEDELTRERGLWGPNNPSKLDKWMLDSTEGPARRRKKMVRNDLFYIHYPFRPNLDLPEFKSLKYKVAVSLDSKLYYERMKLHRPRAMDARVIDTSTLVATPSEDKLMIIRDVKDLNSIMIRRASLVHQKAPSKSELASALEEEEPVAPFLDASTVSPDQVSSSITHNPTGEDEENETSPPPTERMDTMTSSETSSIGTIASRQSSIGGRLGSEPGKVESSPATSSPVKGPDNQTLLRLLEEGEELQSMFRTARISGLETSEGLLLFGRTHFYIVDGYTLLKTREIRDLDFLPEEFHDPIIPYTATGSTRIKGQRRQCSKFAYEDIREVHKRRYLLQPIALEVYSSDGRNYLLAFPKKTRNKVYHKFLSVAKAIINTADQSVSGQRSSANVESSGSLLSNLIGDTSVTQRWVKGEISNFQYLMFLNTLAGRSYNDLMQYPVFPWVLADYESEDLDLCNPDSFRDLSKPMGAQTEERLEQFLKRYREWDDPTGEIPPYIYGTHYSSAMIVVSYLVRIEPFTQQFLKLQGGHFDLADRMFHSIKDAWMSASKNNMADVKELIPEFFYLPEFLLNSNNFDLGTKQSGARLGDVVLPTWAKDDPREFIRVHREALECDYVSAHLHDWIDLIFGYKQQGQSAIDAQNLYHHLFYEGNVDFETIEDPLVLNATIGFINNFGQIPTQLFKKPHPQKKLKSPDLMICNPGFSTERLFYHCLDTLRPPNAPFKELKGPVGQIVQTEPKTAVCAVEQNKFLIPPSYTKYIAWGFPDNSIRLGTYDNDKSVCIHESGDCGDIVCAVCPNNRTVITGSTNTVLTVWEIMPGVKGSTVSLRLRKSLYGHSESISALAASGSYGVIVSGSQDGSCLLWDLAGLCLIRQLGPHPGIVTALAINETTGEIASCSGTHLFLWSLNGVALAWVNTATASAKSSSKQIIMSVAFSSLREWDPQNLIVTGSNDGVVRMWSLDYTQVPDDGCSQLSEMSEMDKEAALNPRPSVPSLDAFRGLNPETLREKLMQRQDTSLSRCSFSTSPEYICSPDGFKSPSSGFKSQNTYGISDSSTPLSRRSDSREEEERDFVVVDGKTLSRKPSSSDSLVYVNKDGLAIVRTPSKLRCGFKWQRQLLFRSKLTMHTSFERKDNSAPAAITAMAPSRDHKALFVGDNRGRVWSWCVPEGNYAGRADHWIQDPSRNLCAQCGQKFSFSERKHHCRNCGQIFCANCSRYETELKHMKISKPVRVCQQCFQKLKGPKADES